MDVTKYTLIDKVHNKYRSTEIQFQTKILQMSINTDNLPKYNLKIS